MQDFYCITCSCPGGAFRWGHAMLENKSKSTDEEGRFTDGRYNQPQSRWGFPETLIWDCGTILWHDYGKQPSHVQDML